MNDGMATWWSIEVIDGAGSSSLWAHRHGDALVEAALLDGARDWSWHEHPWGVVFEVEFDSDDAWERFRLSPAVVAALDAVPDPVSGLIIYRGRGGSAGRGDPRRPRPLAGAGAAALPLPLEDDVFTDLVREVWQAPILTLR
jgi:hypothetical protein